MRAGDGFEGIHGPAGWRVVILAGDGNVVEIGIEQVIGIRNAEAQATRPSAVLKVSSRCLSEAPGTAFLSWMDGDSSVFDVVVFISDSPFALFVFS